MGWLIDCVQHYGDGIRVSDAVHLRQLIINAFGSLVSVRKDLRALQESVFEKDICHEKEVKELKNVLDATAKLAGTAATGRNGMVTAIKGLLKLVEEVPSQEALARLNLSKYMTGMIPRAPAATGGQAAVAGDAAPQPKAAPRPGQSAAAAASAA